MIRTRTVLTALTLVALFAVGANAKPKSAPDPTTEKFVFLADTRPVLVRIDIEVDGKPLLQQWNAFLDHVFTMLDIDKNGSLDKQEARRMPSISDLSSPNGRIGGFGLRMDTSKKEKVTKQDLAEFWLKSGLGPFQLQLSEKQNSQAGMARAYFSGQRPAPPVAAVRRQSFQRIDANGDGFLSLEELRAAPKRILVLDRNEDELISVEELAPDDVPTINVVSLGMMAGSSSKINKEGTSRFLPLPPSGKAPTKLVERVLQLYRHSKEKAAKLTKESRLDSEAFARLDTNSDGVVDKSEIEAIVTLEPDHHVIFRLGKTNAPRVVRIPPIQSDPKRPNSNTLVLDLGRTRLETRTEVTASSDPYDGQIQQQTLLQLQTADKDRDGSISKEEATANPSWGSIFNRVDINADGKVTIEELTNYLSQASKLRALAARSMVTLTLSDESRGLFSLFDSNQDGKLSVRELRGGEAISKKHAKDDKGLSPATIPTAFRVSVKLGPASNGVNPQAIFALYAQGGYRKKPSTNGIGPTWFQKMDRNRDGDISRSEFLFSTEQFDRIDKDGDGLIDAKEAASASQK